MAAIAPCYGTGYATTSDPMVVFTTDDTCISGTNIPAPPPAEVDDELEAKLEERERNNARSLEGTRTLHTTHGRMPTTCRNLVVTARAPRSTRRRTATGVRNWRARV